MKIKISAEIEFRKGNNVVVIAKSGNHSITTYSRLNTYERMVAGVINSLCKKVKQDKSDKLNGKG